MSLDDRLTNSDKFVVLLWLYSYLLAEIRGINTIFYYIKLIMTIIFIMYMCIKINFKFKVDNFAKNIIIIVIFCNMGSLLKMFLHPNPMRVLVWSLSNIVFFMVIFICIPNYFDKDTKFKSLIYFISRGITVFLLINIVLGILDWNNSFTNYYNRFRVIWTFFNANRLGSICYLLIITSIYLIINDEKAKKIPNIFILAFAFINLILCGSRTPLICGLIFILGMIINSIVYFGKRQIKYVNIKKYIIASIFVLILLYITNININLDINSITSGRWEFWKTIWNEFRIMEKLIGITQNDVYNSINYIQKYILQGRNVGVDNYYMSVIYNYGVVYLTVLLFTISYIFMRINRYLKLLFTQGYNNFKTYYCILSIIISFVIYGIFESLFISISNIVSLVIWMIISRYTSKKILNRIREKESINEYC